MEPVLEVPNLCKYYPGFRLEGVTFSLQPGRICGFLGRNGAGKTTTIKSILGLVHPDAGTVKILGQDFSSQETALRSRIGYASGGVDFYPRKRLSEISRQTRPFYPQWDENTYHRLIERFHLDESKCVRELSEGMKVKYQLALALSHGAQLLILDEPTSGLDPVSRAELTDIFQVLAKQGTAILFSTHITADLLSCAQDILYLRQGQLLAAKPLPDFLADHPDCANLDEIMVTLEKEKCEL